MTSASEPSRSAGSSAPESAETARSGGRRRSGPRSRSAARRTPRSRPERTWTIADLSGIRAVAYQVFALLLLPPTEPRLQRLAAAAGELRGCDDGLAAFGFFSPWRQLLSALQAIEGRDPLPIEREYVRLFAVSSTGIPCHPYESTYVTPDSRQAGRLVAELQQTYARAGLHLAPSLNESPDHATVELEFMAYLCGREAAAWEQAATDDALRFLLQESAFVRQHLGRWFGVFADRARRATEEPLYALGVTAAEAFIHHDGDLTDAITPEIYRLQRRPSTRLKRQ